MKFIDKLNFGANILKTKLLKQKIPFSVKIAVTSKCNSRCAYCNYYDRNIEEFTLEQFCKLIDELKQMGTKRIALVGGEPLIHKDIDRMVDYVVKNKMRCIVTSNGYLAEEKLSVLKKLEMLVLSIDGPKEINDKNREKGSFDKVIKAIKLAYENKIPLIINTVLTKYNCNDESIDFLLNLSKKYNSLCSFLLLHFPKETTGNAHPFSPTIEKMRNTIRKIIREKEKGAPIYYSTKTYEHILKWPDYTIDKFMEGDPKADNIKGPKCLAGRYYCHIDSNGDIYPCVLTTGEIPTVNYKKVGFKKTWEFVNNHKCVACLSCCRTELNYILSFNIDSLKNVLRGYIKKAK